MANKSKKQKNEPIKEVREAWRVRLRSQHNPRLCLNNLNLRILNEGVEQRCTKPQLVIGRYGMHYIDIDCSVTVAKKLLKTPGLLEFAHREDYK